MKSDVQRVKRFLAEIRKNSLELNHLIDQNDLKPYSVPLKAAKYDFDDFITEIEYYLEHQQ